VHVNIFLPMTRNCNFCTIKLIKYHLLKISNEVFSKRNFRILYFIFYTNNKKPHILLVLRL